MVVCWQPIRALATWSSQPALSLTWKRHSCAVNPMRVRVSLNGLNSQGSRGQSAPTPVPRHARLTPLTHTCLSAHLPWPTPLPKASNPHLPVATTLPHTSCPHLCPNPGPTLLPHTPAPHFCPTPLPQTFASSLLPSSLCPDALALLQFLPPVGLCPHHAALRCPTPSARDIRQWQCKQQQDCGDGNIMMVAMRGTSPAHL